MKKTILAILILAFCVSISGAGITDKLRAVIAAKNAGGAPPAGLAYIGAVTGAIESDNPLSLPTMSYNAGDLVVVTLGYRYTDHTLSSVSDGTNSWTCGTDHETEDIETETCYSVIGSSQTDATIVITFTNNLYMEATALRFTGSFPITASVLDKDIKEPDSLGSTTDAEITSGVFAQASEVVVVQVVTDGATTCTADTGDGFTEASDGVYTCVSYKIISETTSLTVNTTLGTSDYYLAGLTSYKGQ